MRVLLSTRVGLALAGEAGARTADVVAEIDTFVAQLRSGAAIDQSRLKKLFQPAGLVEEALASGGWGNYFPLLAEQIDAALSIWNERR